MKGRWWGSEWFAGLAMVIAGLLTLRPDPFAGIEGWLYDLAAELSASAIDEHGVTVVASDAPALQRDQLPLLLEQLNRASPRAVALYWAGQSPFPPELIALRHAAAALLKQQPQQSDMTAALQQVAQLAEGEQRLSRAMRGGNALLLALPPSFEGAHRWQFSLRELVAPLPPRLADIARPDPLYSTAVYQVADDTAMRLPPGVARRIPLLYQRADGTVVPTLPVQLWLLSQQLVPDALQIQKGALVAHGKQIPTDSAGHLYPRWSRAAVHTVPLTELLVKESAHLDALRNRVVLIGPTGVEQASRITLPDGRVVAPVEMAALTLTALMEEAVVRVPLSARWVQLGTLLMVALFLTLLLPRLSSSAALLVGGGVLLALFNAQLLLFLLRGEWLPLATPLLVLGAGLVLLVMRRKATRHLRQLRDQLGQVTVALAQQLRQQGQLDEALLQLQQCPVAQAGEELYQLGLDYERKRQFNKAEQLFAYLQKEKPGFKDVAERARSNREARERIIIAGHPSSNMTATLVLNQTALQKPVVGRYQVERELGRGAMGMVYLAHDPKISRTVAIKTVSLAHDFDDRQLEQVRERFFREAESAGRLNHPNIVTIYDVGEEGDLAYIAMDYLPGVSLDHHTCKEKLLAVEEVLAIILQVADALDYAHDKGVVHRDIKPANIIYDQERGVATVTDFGVAHLSDASKTRTGTILGSPYYMAPEQLAGARVDGRADLFSLGVTFYQLLTGTMPFEADSITTLMYKIANSRHVSVSKLRRGVPTCASRIVNQLLQKEPEKRYQSGGELQKALQRCLK